MFRKILTLGLGAAWSFLQANQDNLSSFAKGYTAAMLRVACGQVTVKDAQEAVNDRYTWITVVMNGEMVAFLPVPHGTPAEDAVQFAWENTQHGNRWYWDTRPGVKVAPTHVGTIRSTMVGDSFIYDGKRYLVAPASFPCVDSIPLVGMTPELLGADSSGSLVRDRNGVECFACLGED